MPTAVDIYTAVRRFETAYASAMRPLAEQLSMAQPAVDILLFLANNPGRDTARDICTYRKLKPAALVIAQGRALQERFSRQLVRGLTAEDAAHFERCLTVIGDNMTAMAEDRRKNEGV